MNTKDIIVEEARKVFEKFGFSKTSMADIALAARKGRRTLYTYFTSKEEVFRAVIETEVNNLVIKLGEIIHQDIPVEIKLRQYLQARMNALRELTVYYDALREDFVNNLGLIEDLRKEYDEMEVSMIQGLLDEGVSKQKFVIEDTHLVSRAIVVAVKGFELPIFFRKDNYDYNQLIAPMIDLFFRGVMVKQ